MLAGEGRHKEAIALLKRRLTAASGDPTALAALGRSYAAVGDSTQAVDMFDAYLRLRPHDVAARERDAELLLRGGQIDRYLATMADVTAEAATPVRVTRLVELYRLHGRFQDERDTLRTYAELDLLNTSQLERLGALLAERGDWAGARRWLEQADADAPPEESAGRFLLLEAMIERGDAAAIEDRSHAWMEAWKNAYLSGKLILRLAQSDLSATALTVALDFTEIMPNDVTDIVGLLSSRGLSVLAREMVARWGDRAVALGGAELAQYVRASAAVGDPGIALKAFVQLASNDAESASLAEMAEEICINFGRPALSAVRPFLSENALRVRPLFGAEVALAEGNPEMARWFLKQSDPDRLAPDQVGVWLTLMHRAQLDTEALPQYVHWQQLAAVPPNAASESADAAGRPAVAVCPALQ